MLATETSIASVGERSTPVARHGQLSVKGAELLDAGGKPAVLRGLSFGWDNWWPQYYNANVVHWLWESPVQPAMASADTTGNTRPSTRIKRLALVRIGKANHSATGIVLAIVDRGDHR